MLECLGQLIQSPAFIWCIIFFVLLIGRFGMGLKYLSVVDIIKNHIMCFKNTKGKILIIPALIYLILPFFMGIATVLIKVIDTNTINIITIIISILTAMLFTMLTMIVDMKSKIKQNPNYYSSEAKLSEESLIESYYAVMFEILVAVILLVFCFVNCFTNAYDEIQSFFIYSLTYLLIVNLLMIVKRIYRVIDTDMNK